MKFVFLLFFSSILFSCNNENKKKTETTANDSDSSGVAENKQLVFDKLVGTWKSEDGKSFERWIKNADGTFQSAVYSVKEKDTTWNEQAKIYMETDKWVYENTVSGQNNGKSVKFTSTSLSESNVQFSNPAHDFPNDINYTVADENTVRAFIVGKNEKGGKDTIPFNYTRVKM
jgi:hypothetical protein